MPPNVRLFAGFTSSLAFRSSVIFIVRLKKFQSTLPCIRKSILEADREIIEEWKWMGSPVWSHDGIIAVANAHKDKVKLTFAHGASLPDPDKLFNAGLGGNAWRAIDV